MRIFGILAYFSPGIIILQSKKRKDKQSLAVFLLANSCLSVRFIFCKIDIFTHIIILPKIRTLIFLSCSYVTRSDKREQKSLERSQDKWIKHHLCDHFIKVLFVCWVFCGVFHIVGRPDMTFAVDCALNSNYLSIYLTLSGVYFILFLLLTDSPFRRTNDFQTNFE